MAESPVERIVFKGFEFDPEGPALYFAGNLVKVEKKALEVLAVLLRTPNKVVRTQEIVDEVWRDSPYGITPMHVSQTIRKLRKAFAGIDAETVFIETVKGSGYIFLPAIERRSEEYAGRNVRIEAAANVGSDSPRRSRKLHIAVSVGILLLALLFVGAWVFFPSRSVDEAEVRRIIEESQRFESLVLYRDPSSFQETDLDKYWTAEVDSGSNYDRQVIRTGVRNLIDKGLRYGPESKNEQFEFQSVEVNVNGDMAVVRTLERWFIAEYRNDGTLARNKTVGPYFVSYVLRKIDGRWLIERSTTARATPPAPVIASITPVGALEAGKQAFINIEGSAFNTQNVYIRVVGPGCPEDNPCSVPNSALRLHSELSEIRLANVPVTLASGDFLISALNGESPPSEPKELTIP